MSRSLRFLLSFFLITTASAVVAPAAFAAQAPPFFIVEKDRVTPVPAGDGQAKNQFGAPMDTLTQRLARERTFTTQLFNKDGSATVVPGQPRAAAAVSPDECLEIDTGEPNFQHKDRFSSCRTYGFGIGRPEDGSLTFLVTTAYTAATDGTQGIRADVYIHDGQVEGNPPPEWYGTQVGIQVMCSAISTSCSTSDMTLKTMGEWVTGEHRFWQTIIPSGTTTARDGKAFYEVGQTFYDPVTNTRPVIDRTDFFRCDTATYIPGAAQGCVFTARTPVMNFGPVRSKYPDIVDHIAAAQYHPETTKPGTFTLIPGSVEAGTPLTRLYPAYDTATYNRNHAKAVATCVEFWGTGYTQGGTLDCDEYPFRSTYQGAAYSDNGGTVGYSAKPIALSQNRSAGNDVGTFYKDYRILDSDGYFVSAT
ncbi:hypothetical protein [Amycolatopsis sp. SID8362]|uniref:NucA/NucB deoxyribonuclease domain-containing protein n=1 Tax=Amycolatopsis sp. SID8362 TaxID=2690346 RepID=UPI0013708D51|nr:hypothetical protein [Amycolatopsis sp. SID8362]NBH07452.1 hypothetical protein [Amycolatopsis sp. SID8362]NED44148.1 hypothetical protein [Amycolatopsis sp. SID8362]